jgi:hypothetical protein
MAWSFVDLTGKGPEHDSDFWTASLPGDQVFIEVIGTDEPKFEITDFVHFDHDIGFSNEKGDYTIQQLPCHLDVMCESVNTIARNATGQMISNIGGDAFACTGTLLADMDDETWVPYFLTARHCISTQTVADTLEVVWFWQRNSCGGALPNYNALPRNTGSTLLETSSENDMSFLRLHGEVPGGIGFAGWTTETSVDNAYGIHHPAGSHLPGDSWKRYVSLDPASLAICEDPWDFDHYDMVRGLTEGGSSGSCVFDSSGRCAGQLSLLCDGGNITCSNIDDFWAVYGEFEETYPLIRRWLEIGGTIHVDGSYSGREEGTPTKPFNTVSEANNFAWDGARIKIQAGSYPETLVFSKTLTVLATGGAVIIGE